MAPAKTVYEYFIVYKPFQVLSRFGVEAGKKNLKDFFPVSRNVYPVGRLDYDSEGLLILTNDPVINYRLLHPGFSHEREYWAQVEGDAGNAVLDILAAGPVISIDGKRYKTMPCKVAILPDTVSLPERNPPIRFRAIADAQRPREQHQTR